MKIKSLIIVISSSMLTCCLFASNNLKNSKPDFNGYASESKLIGRSADDHKFCKTAPILQEYLESRIEKLHCNDLYSWNNERCETLKKRYESKLSSFINEVSDTCD